MNIRQKLTVVCMDVMLVAELALCMYFGQRTGDDLTAFFVKTYVPALIVTVAVARYLIRRWQDAPGAGAEDAKCLAAGDGAVSGNRA